ncbi:hypothetical protein [Tractidigestivibacter scatoligenes]|nr:hypothetical protein [Tractidigestivibacter scatoligenes]
MKAASIAIEKISRVTLTKVNQHMGFRVVAKFDEQGSLQPW